MKALVTDADLVGAVAGMRALARNGVEVIATAPGPRAAGLLSRSASVRDTGPDPVVEPAAFAAHVAALARRHGPLAVYPSREESIDALMAARDELPPEVVLPYAGSQPLRALRDKRELPPLAAAAGVHTPRTVAEGPASRLAREPHVTPVVVKPQRRGPGIPEVTVAHSATELADQLAAYPPGEGALLQEHLAGPLICLAVVVGRDGALVERFQQEATRIFPLEAGACSVAIGTPADEALCAAVARMLAEAGFWGLAQLDFVQTAEGPRLIDVNPRFYISLGLAVASGVNLPAAWHAVVTGTRWPGPSSYRPGTSYRRLESDFAAAFRGHPGLLLAAPPRPRTGAVWSWKDPLPGLSIGLQRIAGFGAKRVPFRPGADDSEELPVTIEPLTDRARAEAEWRALETSAEPSPYLSWDWLAAWLDVYAPADPALVRIGEPPVALGLLDRRGPRWHFAGAPVTPDRGLLVAESDQGRAWAALGAALDVRRGRWGSLSFASAPAAARVLPGVELEPCPTWSVALPGDFDTYIAERSATQRKAHKQKLRRLLKAGGEVVLVPPEQHREALQAFLDLHARRAAEKGERHPQMNADLLALLERLGTSEGAALRVFELRVAGRRAGISVRIDRPGGRGAWFFNAGFDPAHGQLGPGVVLELESIRDAIARGHGHFDLGPGLWRYKLDLGGEERPLFNGEAFCPSLRGRLLRVAVLGWRRAYAAVPGRGLLARLRRAASSRGPSTPA